MSPPPPTYFVVCLHEDCTQEAAQFIVDGLRRSHKLGGAELEVHQEEIRPDGLILHVSARKARLLQLAESVGLKTADVDGVVRDFSAGEVDNFPPSGLVGPLTLSDVHRCVLHAMESLHFGREQRTLPGHARCKVMKGAPILAAYREAGLVDTFPLHDDEEMERLWKRWKDGKIFSPPIDEIRAYFGENLALYFSFTAFYTSFLIPIAILGITQFILDRFLGIDVIYSNLIFACLNLVAVTVFLEMWKRRSNEHGYKWGTGGKLRHKRPRPEFRGSLVTNEITGREEMQYPITKTLTRVWFVSVPVTLACLLVAFVLMLGSFEADFMIHRFYHDHITGEYTGGMVGNVVVFIPTVLYSVLVLLMNQYYLHLAHYLTEWENHRTQEQFERFVVAKLILFEFVNTFLALFYIAFYLQDVVMLKSQVFTMLIVLQAVNQIQETLLPIFLKRPSTRRVMNKVSKRLNKNPSSKTICKHGMVDNVPCLGAVDNQVSMANYSLVRTPYESTYDDFMEIWLQFGHVFLFSSVYPLAGFFALLNNLLELKMDAYKICKLSRKPTPRATRDIGAWYAAFSVTSIISVMTNCALLAMDKDLQAFAPNASEKDWILTFVAIEHVFLFIRIAISLGIPDVPKDVKKAMDRDEYILKNKKGF